MTRHVILAALPTVDLDQSSFFLSLFSIFLTSFLHTHPPKKQKSPPRLLPHHPPSAEGTTPLATHARQQAGITGGKNGLACTPSPCDGVRPRAIVGRPPRPNSFPTWVGRTAEAAAGGVGGGALHRVPGPLARGSWFLHLTTLVSPVRQ